MKSLTSSDPREIGGIRLWGRLGQGGMARVYYGVMPDGEPVAVKVILPAHADSPTMRRRFDREIQAMRMVQGREVAKIVDSGEYDGRPWLAVEYIRGMTLREYIDAHGPMSVEHGAALGALVAEAVRAIHKADLFHRDLSPRNILLGADGPKVIDFGLVALAEGESDLTGNAEVLGTPGCLSPEQISDPKNVTGTMDVYGLGACLLFGTTAHLPYEQQERAALLFAVASAEKQPDLTGLPAELAPLITQMLDKAPDRRPTLREVTARLSEILAMPTEMGRARLIAATYIERPDDPSPDGDRPARLRPPRPKRRESTGSQTPIVQRLSDRVRRDYARGDSL